MRWIYRVLLGAVLLTVLAFGTLAVNQQKVPLRFHNYTSPEIDLFWWLLGSLSLGLLLGLLLASYSLLRMKLRERKARKEKQQLRNQLDTLLAQQAPEAAAGEATGTAA